MKRILLICAVLAAFSASLFAHDFDSPVFSPVTAEVLGQGGSFTAVAHGYNALFTNPAGFARKGGSFTLLSASVTPYFVPSEGDIDNLGELVGDHPEDGISLLSDLITDNGIGGNVSTGIGIVGKGLGLGLVGGFDFYGRGDYAMATEIDASYTWAAIAGYAVPIEIGFSTLYIGGIFATCSGRRLRMLRSSIFSRLPTAMRMSPFPSITEVGLPWMPES